MTFQDTHPQHVAHSEPSDSGPQARARDIDGNQTVGGRDAAGRDILNVILADLPEGKLREIVDSKAQATLWQELVDQLRDSGLGFPHAVIQEAYDAVPRATDPLPAALDDARLFLETIDLLNDIPPFGVPVLLEFVAALVAYHEPSRLHLKDWIATACKLWDISEQQLAERRIAAEESSLLIAIIGKTDEYLVRAWIWSSKGEVRNIRNSSQRYSRSQVRDLLSDIINDAKRLVSHPSGLTVEFFLPRALLIEPVHSWPVLRKAISDDGDEEISSSDLYKIYKVVVRSTARSFQPSRNNIDEDNDLEDLRKRWKGKWRSLIQLANSAAETIVKPTCPEDFLQRLRDAFAPVGIALCYAETIAPPDGLDMTKCIFQPLIDSGIPAGIWVASGGDRSPVVYEHIKKLLSPSLRDLPKTLARVDMAVRPSLILFWDNPERVPEDREGKFLKYFS